MIIAVNISKSLKAGHSVMTATERAWALTLGRCQVQDYVIGVENGQICGYFVLINAHNDAIDARRVAFNLRSCTPNEKAIIDAALVGIDLRYIQRGRYI